MFSLLGSWKNIVETVMYMKKKIEKQIEIENLKVSLSLELCIENYNFIVFSSVLNLSLNCCYGWEKYCMWQLNI